MSLNVQQRPRQTDELDQVEVAREEIEVTTSARRIHEHH